MEFAQVFCLLNKLFQQVEPLLHQSCEAIARLDTQNQVAQLNQLRAQKAQAEAVLQEIHNELRVEMLASARAEVSDLQNQLALETIRRARREYLQQE